jgi:hypothetical protein
MSNPVGHQGTVLFLVVQARYQTLSNLNGKMHSVLTLLRSWRTEVEETPQKLKVDFKYETVLGMVDGYII